MRLEGETSAAVDTPIGDIEDEGGCIVGHAGHLAAEHEYWVTTKFISLCTHFSSVETEISSVETETNFASTDYIQAKWLNCEYPCPYAIW